MIVKNNKKTIWKLLAYTALITSTILTIAPLLWLFITAFKPHKDIIQNIFSLPKSFYFDNFTRAWELGNLGVYILNSFLYASISTVITVYLAMSVGYAIQFFPYTFSKYIYAFFLFGLLITVHAVLVPLFLMETKLNIDDTRLGIIIPYIAFGLPFLVYLACSFLKGLSLSLVESAKMDGASHFKILHKIIMPVSSPIIATMAIFSFLGNWNEFVFVFVLTTKESLRSLPVGINAFAGGMARNYGLLYASLVIGIIPMLLIYIFAYKKIVEGVSGGSVKE